MCDNFTHKIFRTIIARACKNMGFKTASESSLDILVDAAIMRITEIAKSAARRSSYCGRTDSNAYDVCLALYEVRETFNRLVTFYNESFLRNQHIIQPFEYLVSPYPIITSSNFYRSQISQQRILQHQQNTVKTDIYVPFRANTTISYFQIPNNQNNSISVQTTPTTEAPSSPHIPAFFPHPPQMHAYDETLITEKQSEEEKRILSENREKDQSESKESLARLNKSKLQDQYNSHNLELDLVKPPEIIWPIAKWNRKNKSGIYLMEGERKKYDPEFIPQDNLCEELIADGNLTKEIKQMIIVLKAKPKSNDGKEGKGQNEDT